MGTRAVPSVRKWAQHAANPLIPVYLDWKLAYGFRQKDMIELPPIALSATSFTKEISKSKRWDDDAGKRVGEVKVYAITPETREILRRIYALKRPQSTERLFSTPTGTPYTSEGFRGLWYRCMGRYLEQVPGAVRFHEHDLRATTATADAENAQKRLPHKWKTTTDGYLRSFGVEVIEPLELSRIPRKAGKNIPQ